MQHNTHAHPTDSCLFTSQAQGSESPLQAEAQKATQWVNTHFKQVKRKISFGCSGDFFSLCIVDPMLMQTTIQYQKTNYYFISTIIHSMTKEKKGKTL